MRNLFQKSNPSPKLPRNAFDLSQHQVFSAKAGQLLPIFCDEVNPNESFKLNASSFLRTQPLNTASYARLTQRIDFFFVPFRLLCNRFFTTLYGTQYSTTSHTTLTPPDFTPIRILQSVLRESLTNLKNGSDVFGMSLFDNACKLLDLLGYGNYYYINYGHFDQRLLDDLKVSSPDLLPFRLCAYQKVYEDFFRNTDYEASSNYWNLDSTFDSKSSYLAKGKMEPLLTMRYANCNRDYFSATHASYQGSTFLVNPAFFPTGDQGYFGSGSQQQVQTFTPPLTNNGVVARTGSSTIEGENLTSYDTVVDSTNMMGFAGSYNNQASTSAAAIRAAFALDKLYRSSIEAADGSYASQVKAHLGYSMKHDPYKSIYLGGSSSPVQINEVLTTANTEHGTTGDIFGRGLSLDNGKEISFTSNEHGFIIGIFSVVPENLYPSVGIDYMNTAFNRTQWYQPEFQDLGYQPIAGYELTGIFPSTGQLSNDYLKDSPRVLGFTPRYAQYKTKVDKVHFPFYTYSYTKDGIVSDSGSIKGSLTAWSLPRYSALTETFSENAFLSRKVSPHVIDPISSIKDDGTVNTDFLLCSVDVKCNALRNMSVDGQPNL